MSYFSMITYVVGTHYKHFACALQMSTSQTLQNLISDKGLHCLPPDHFNTDQQVKKKNIIFFLIFFYRRKTRLVISCESSARQVVHMKYQALVSLKTNRKKKG